MFLAISNEVALQLCTCKYLINTLKLHEINDYFSFLDYYGKCLPTSKLHITYICILADKAHLDACLTNWRRVDEKFFMNQEEPKNQPHPIILTLNLIVLKFNVILIVDIFRLNPKVNEDAMNFNLGLMQIMEWQGYQQATLKEGGSYIVTIILLTTLICQFGFHK